MSQKDMNKDGHCSKTRSTHVSHCSIALKRYQDGGNYYKRKHLIFRLV